MPLNRRDPPAGIRRAFEGVSAETFLNVGRDPSRTAAISQIAPPGRAAQLRNALPGPGFLIPEQKGVVPPRRQTPADPHQVENAGQDDKATKGKTMFHG